jgi:hypothetical protein
VSTLLEALATQLGRPRDVTIQVANYLSGNYDVDRDAIGPFLANRLPELEDYEHDLILSPLYTPKLADQTIFAELLGKDSVRREEWPALIQQLVVRPTHGHLVTSDRQIHEIRLREVTLERYVHRLRLDGSIPAALFDLIERVPNSNRSLLKAISRRAIWDSGSRRSILQRYLTSAGNRGGYQEGDVVHLLDLAESYKPSDVAALLAMIPSWQQSLEHEIDTSANSRPFFTAQTQGEHGGDRDQRRPDERRIEMKKNELATLGRLKQMLAE